MRCGPNIGLNVNDRRKAEVARVLSKAGRIDFHRKWILFEKSTDTAHDHVADSEHAAEKAIVDLGLDREKWEVGGPIEFAASSEDFWIDPLGEPHFLAIRFKNVGTSKEPAIVVFVDLANGETRRYDRADIEWSLFAGTVDARR